jgi:hypothetical protein
MKRTAAVCLAVCAISMARAAADDAVIFSGEDRFRKNWTSSAWGGLEVREGEGENGAAVSTVITEKTTPWSGVNFHVAFDQDRAKNAVPLDADLKEGGMVVLKLNCGKDREGQPGTGQKLQVSFSFLNNGKPVPAPALPLARFGVESLDGDETTWQEVKIPISTMLEKIPDSSGVDGLVGVGIQYVESPACEILVGDCRVQKD